MLEVAARIPDAAARDQFADRLAHKAQITEEVVRAEIRKAAVQKKTTAPDAGAAGAGLGQVKTGRTGPDLGAAAGSGGGAGGAGRAGTGGYRRSGDAVHPGTGTIPAGMAAGELYRRR